MVRLSNPLAGVAQTLTIKVRFENYRFAIEINK